MSFLALGEPAVERGGGNFLKGAGTIDTALPVADAHLNVAPGVEICCIELETYPIESDVDAVKDGYQFGGGAVRGSCGIQHKVAYGAIEALSLLSYSFNRSAVDADYQGVGTYNVTVRKALLTIGIEHRLVVTDSGAHGVVGRLDVQRGAQRLVESVDGIECSGVFIEFIAHVAVSLALLAAVLVKHIVAHFQRTAGKKQAALRLVVVDVRFHRHKVKAPLRVHGENGAYPPTRSGSIHPLVS